MYTVNRRDLGGPLFEGAKHGGSSVSFFLVDNSPGEGPRLHRHPYDETWIVVDGQAQFWAGDDTGRVTGGQIVVAPRDTPHRFENVGSGRLHMVCIHASPKVIQEDL
jgi:mannose-6-phosphate isomerase-like protein (cupin superfamily)